MSASRFALVAVAALLLPTLAASVVLPPPAALGGGWLRVPVGEKLAIDVLEANSAEQTRLVDVALDADHASAAQDPYGVVVWPAAQVCAAEIAAAEIAGLRVLELGAGTGLCSLAAAACGAADVLATDYRDEPLALLRQSAERGGFALRTAQFDILDAARPLPAADVLVAADLLYLRSTSEALGRRCAEALRAGCASIIVGDCGRPGRAAFLAALVASGVREESARFEAVDGWSAGTARHELISTTDAAPTATGVGLLRLTPDDLIE